MCIVFQMVSAYVTSYRSLLPALEKKGAFCHPEVKNSSYIHRSLS